MKRVLFSMILLIIASFAFAQEKNVKEAKKIANEVKPDFSKAEQLINEALTNPETKDNPETWDVAGFIQKRINEKENLYGAASGRRHVHDPARRLRQQKGGELRERRRLRIFGHRKENLHRRLRRELPALWLQGRQRRIRRLRS